LDDFEDLLLNQAGFVADANHDITLRHNNLPVGFGCRVTTMGVLITTLAPTVKPGIKINFKRIVP
jgi:hypothetical protein